MSIEGKGELIETLWNVNVFFGIDGTDEGLELIETLWNVNTGGIICPWGLAMN